MKHKHTIHPNHARHYTPGKPLHEHQYLGPVQLAFNRVFVAPAISAMPICPPAPPINSNNP